MLVIRYRWKGKCPKHPRYNPGKNGEAAIKGGCETCSMLFHIWKAHRRMLDHSNVFDAIQQTGHTISAINSAVTRAFESR